MGSIVQGFAFGTGSSIARHGVDAVLGGGSSSAPAPAPAAPVYQQQQQQVARGAGACDVDQFAFTECIRTNPGNVAACEFYMQALQQCQFANARA